jgi:hypothetical protein
MKISISILPILFTELTFRKAINKDSTICIKQARHTDTHTYLGGRDWEVFIHGQLGLKVTETPSQETSWAWCHI